MSYQVMKSGNQMQWQKNNGAIYNTTDLGTITNVEIVLTTGNNATFTTFYGTSEKPSSSTEVGGGYFQVKVGNSTGSTQKIEVTFEISDTPIPSLSVSPASIAFGEKAINTSNEETFTVNFANLTQDLTVSVGDGLTGVSVSSETISKNATSPQTVTVTYAPSTVGNISGNITVSNTTDEVSKTIAVTGSAFDPDDVTYYEKVTSSLSDWSGDYIFTGINSSKYYALTGVSNNLGTTAEVSVTEDGIVSNSTTNAYKVTIAPTTNGYSLYMEGVGYLSYSSTGNNLNSSSNFTESNCEWTISFANGLATITNVESNTRILQFNYNNGNPRFACYATNQTKLTLFKLDDGTPSISADDIEIEYDATSGSIAYTINNPTSETLSASTTSEWLTLGTVGASPIPFTCSANNAKNARTATVTLTYGTVTKNVTVTQAGNPNVPDNISDITAAGTYSVRGTIVAKSQRGFIVGDGTGYVYYYNQNYIQDDYNIGDMVNLNGSVVAYGGVFEFNNSTTITAATESNYEAEDPTVLTGSQMDARVASTSPAQLSNYVQYEGLLTVSGTYYNITNINGATTAKGSISYPLNTDFTSLDGKIVKVTGYYVGVSSSQYYNTLIGSIEEVVSTTPVIIVNQNTLELAYDATSGSIGYDITNPADGVNLAATTTAEWISNITVGTEAVTFTTSENDGTADRTATITLSYTGAESVVVTVTQKHYVADYATLPFEFDGGVNDIANTPGLTQSGLGGDYSSSPKLRFDNTGDYLIIHFTDRPGYLTFDIKGNTFSGGTFSVQISEDGTNYTDLQTYTELGSTQSESFNNLGENVRYIKWIYTTKASGNVALGNIYVARYETVPATITAAGYATFANAKAVDFSAETGLTVMTAEYANGTISYSVVDSKKVPAGEAVILQGAEGTYNATVIASADALQNNDLQVNLNTYETSDGTYYCLANKSKGVGFYKVVEGTIVKQGKAYLVIPASAKDFFSINDETDGINLMENGALNIENAAIYNLNGQRVKNAQKGVYIVNGKKIVVK